MYTFLIPKTSQKTHGKRLYFSTTLIPLFYGHIWETLQKEELTVTGDVCLEATGQKGYRLIKCMLKINQLWLDPWH